ncbi:hypothetical protein Godav_004424 [Gossypium davidsonii]|uniref:Uncharacterized protein n=1 Tax=Gossypium davidsonii TaxID=34287 RepID=A0A7J8SL87_GOSDV|nr:hypothetical protein [Gossypium davidsonii]
MKEMKDGLRGLVERANTSRSYGSKSPQIQIQEIGSSLAIALNTGFNSQFIFNETIRIVHEERVEVMNANFSVVDDDTVFHTIHLTVLIATIGEPSAAARISQRLNKFVHDVDASNKY